MAHPGFGISLGVNPSRRKLRGLSPQPPTNFYGFRIKSIHFNKLFYRKRVCSVGSHYGHWTMQKYFCSLIYIQKQKLSPFVPAAQKLLDSLTKSDIRAAQWMDYVWNMEYLKSASRLHAFIPRASPKPLGMGLPRTSWVKLNRLRTGVGRFHSSMYKWGAGPSPDCECGASEQTADHIISTCSLHRAPKGIQGLLVLDDDTRRWLKINAVNI